MGIRRFSVNLFIIAMTASSMGYAIINLSNETIDDFMNRIDEQMYQDKMKYYEHNDRRNSK